MAIGEPHDSPLSVPVALTLIRAIAKDAKNILVTRHANIRQKQRRISFLAIQRCLLLGRITEGPFLNQQGHWQVTMQRFASGEELQVVLAIDPPEKLIVITVI